MESPTTGLTRRSLLAAVGLAPLVGTLPLTLPAATAQAASAQLNWYWGLTFTSAYTRRQHDWCVVYPPGHSVGENLPVAILMHGTNDPARVGDSIGALGAFANHLAGAVKATRPFAIATVDGYNGFYQKMDGGDYGKLVSVELIARLKRLGLNTSRLALGGYSMGGWGAFRLAANELHGKVKVIAALSTPCYPSWAKVIEKQEMSKSQFNANNFYNKPSRLKGVPIFIACGKSDPLCPGNRNWAKKLASTKGVIDPKTSFGKGGHSWAYWNSVASAQLKFIGKHI